MLTLGRFPAIGIAEARRRRNTAREALDEFRDPAAERAAKKRAVRDAAIHTFEAVAREWHAAQEHRWSGLYSDQVMIRLETEIFPDVGRRPISMIEPPEMLATLKKVEKRGVIETTRRLRSCCSSVFKFAIASGYCRYDAAGHLGPALKSTPKAEHYAALNRDEVKEFLARLDRHECEPLTRLAIKFIMLTAVRTKELRGANWSEFERLAEPERALWRIPADRMKMRVEHLVARFS